MRRGQIPMPLLDFEESIQIAAGLYMLVQQRNIDFSHRTRWNEALNHGVHDAIADVLGLLQDVNLKLQSCDCTFVHVNCTTWFLDRVKESVLVLKCSSQNLGRDFRREFHARWNQSIKLSHSSFLSWSLAQPS